MRSGLREFGFGLDLSGYSTGRSIFAAAINSGDDEALVFLLNSPFNHRLEGSDEIDDQLAEERGFLERCMALGSVAIDVPIDLQTLGTWQGLWLWQLTKRPVDYAFGALPPLADRLGSVVARFQALLAFAPELRSRLGSQLWETYPAGSLAFLGQSIQYKGGRAVRAGGRWTPNSEKAACIGASELCTKLHLSADDRIALGCDEIDATLSALTALSVDSDRLVGNDVDAVIRERIKNAPGWANERSFEGPLGYLLLRRSRWKKVTVRHMTVDDFYFHLVDKRRPFD